MTAPAVTEEPEWHCDFCRKPATEVQLVLVAEYTDDSVAICDRCVGVAAATVVAVRAKHVGLERLRADPPQPDQLRKERK